MRLVGVTGGISSGKSTVSKLFKSHGIPVVDADLVARNVIMKGTGGWRQVAATFGPEILQPNGQAKMDRWTKPIIVVWVDPETQLKRLVARDGTSEEDAQNRINAQMSLDLKKSKAEIVIDNTGSLDDLTEHSWNVMFEVTRPLTWTEFVLSRQGALFVLGSVIVGVILCKKVFR